MHRIPPPPPSKMLRPNIWVEKIEKLPSRVEGWLRLSAARTRSDWSKTFPARFFENGRVEEEEGGGEGGEGHCYRIVANLGHDRICCPAACLRHIQSKFSSYNRFPAPLPQRIFFVSVLMLIFCAATLFAARVNALHTFYGPVPKIQIQK